MAAFYFQPRIFDLAGLLLKHFLVGHILHPSGSYGLLFDFHLLPPQQISGNAF